jgi:hypothetical protein
MSKNADKVFTQLTRHALTQPDNWKNDTDSFNGKEKNRMGVIRENRFF